MKKTPNWFIVLAAIVFIIIVIVTVGLFSPDLTDDKDQQKKAKEEEDKLNQLAKEKALKALKDELKAIDERIQFCKQKFEQIKIQEKRVLFFSRLGVGILLISLDFLYYNYFRFQPREIMGELLKLNSALVASYTFVAFISHGTPAKFATFLKSKIKGILRWYHKSTYTEYDALLVNKTLTLQIIEALGRPVTEEIKTEKQAVKI